MNSGVARVYEMGAVAYSLSCCCFLVGLLLSCREQTSTS